MGKCKNRQYNKNWEKEFKWLALKNDKATCQWCQCDLTNMRKSAFNGHENSVKHKKAASNRDSSNLNLSPLHQSTTITKTNAHQSTIIKKINAQNTETLTLMPHKHVLHNKMSSDTLRQWHCFGTEVRPGNLIYPVFIIDDPDSAQPISALPGIFRYGINQLCSHLAPLINDGLSSVLLHCAANEIVKDSDASDITSSRNPVILAIKKIKELFPALTVACDVCLCPFTSHGQCALLSHDGTIDNEGSIRRLTELALAYAAVGANVIAPSDMMDGRIGAIKQALHQAGLSGRVSVLSYAAKFSSIFSGEFRRIDCSDNFEISGGRRCYQIPPGSMRMALKAVDRDVSEGADMLAVQPALPYLDVVLEIKEKYPSYTLFAYQVSGEYEMLLNGASADCFDLKSTILESLVSMRRAGVDVIATYFVPLILPWIKQRG